MRLHWVKHSAAHLVKMKHPCVYILASKRNGTLYVGVSSNLLRRVWEHKEAKGSTFTDTYDVKHLVWYEAHQTMEQAISREKAIKEWRRAWKIRLIEEMNPGWEDLYLTLI